MLELLAPAGSPESVIAAVQSGADAVYMGFGDFNARRGAENFSQEEFAKAVRYCRIRGCKVYVTLNTLVGDRELSDAAGMARMASDLGADGIIIQDLGLIRFIREAVTDIPLHASTQMSVHSLTGVQAAARLGCSRAVLARELPADQLHAICRESPIEIEVFGHGALCMCYSGQCWFSAVVGRRSGNRGQCAQPCRLPYGYGHGDKGHPLSLKDNCLIAHLRALEEMGAASLKLEGRMKRPEYVAVVTRVYRAALDGREPGPDDLEALRRVFSRQGFTDGYFQDRTGPDMLGVRSGEREDARLLAAARATYEEGERQRVPVRFSIRVEADRPVTLAVEDPEGRGVSCQGEPPETARSRAVTGEALAERLGRTGGTPYRCAGVDVRLGAGLTLPVRAVNGLRREALERLTVLRGEPPSRAIGVFSPPAPERGPAEPPRLTVQLRHWGQLTPSLLAAGPAALYLPLSELVRRPERAAALACKLPLVAVLPRVIWDREQEETARVMKTAYDAGVRDVLAGNLGQIALAGGLGFRVRGDFGLNVFNSQTVRTLRELGLASATASFELLLAQVRDLDKGLPLELIAYGRLPLMLTENCLVKNRTGKCACQDGPVTLTDRTGASFPILPDPGSCRSVVYNGKQLFLLDKRAELAGLGLWGLRLLFTGEGPEEVDAVVDAWNCGGGFDGTRHTRGLYYRGVE